LTSVEDHLFLRLFLGVTFALSVQVQDYRDLADDCGDHFNCLVEWGHCLVFTGDVARDQVNQPHHNLLIYKGLHDDLTILLGELLDFPVLVGGFRLGLADEVLEEVKEGVKLPPGFLALIGH